MYFPLFLVLNNSPHFPAPNYQMKYITQKEKCVPTYQVQLQGPHHSFSVLFQQTVRGWGGHDFQKEKKATSLVCYCSGKLKEMLGAGNPDKYK